MPAKRKSGRTSTAPTPPSLRFVSVAIVVSDRAKAVEWYRGTLGLEVVDEMDHWVTVGRPGDPARLHLCQTTEFDANGKLEPGNSGILFHLAGKDFRAGCEGLRSRGVEFAQEPRKDPWGWWAMIRDPDGNEHTIMPEG
jgi:catechol 2,3-dioxygenase-like lactoylglutathione lyase family enzyme